MLNKKPRISYLVSSVLLVISLVFSELLLAGGVGVTLETELVNNSELGDPEGSCPAPGKAAGNPINLLSGNKYLKQTLYQAAGDSPLEFSLHYNSHVMKDGMIFGEWGDSYGQHVEFDPLARGSSVYVVRSDGQRIAFENYHELGVPQNSSWYSDEYIVWDSIAPTETVSATGTLNYPLSLPGGKSQSMLEGTYRFSCLKIPYMLPASYTCEVLEVTAFTYNTKEGNKETYKVLKAIDEDGTGFSVDLSDEVAYLTEIETPQGQKQRISRTNADPQSGVESLISVWVSVTDSYNNSLTYEKSFVLTGHKMGTLKTVSVGQLNWSLQEDGNLISSNEHPMYRYLRGPEKNGVVTFTEYLYNTTQFSANANWLYTTAIAGVKHNALPYAAWGYRDDGDAFISYHGTGSDGTFLYNDFDSLTAPFPSGSIADVTILSPTVDALGVAVSDHDNLWITKTNQLGKETNYHFIENPAGSVLMQDIEGVDATNCQGGNVHYAYGSSPVGYTIIDDPSTNLDSITDAKGVVTDYDFDDTDVNGKIIQPLITEVIKAKGTAEESKTNITWYDKKLRLPDLIIKPGLTIDYDYHLNNRLLSRTETDTTGSASNGRSRRWEYSYTYGVTQATLVSQTIKGPRLDKNDDVVMLYNAQGYVSEILNAKGHATKFRDYNDYGLPETIEDANNQIISLTYVQGHDGVLLESIIIGTAVTSYEYHFNSLLKKVNYPGGLSIELFYTNAHELYKVLNNLGESITIDRNRNSSEQLTQFIVQMFDSASVLVGKQEVKYDGLDRLYQVFSDYAGGVAGRTKNYNYDVNGNLEFINEENSNYVDDLGVSQTNTLSTQRVYDVLDRLKEVRAPVVGAAQPGIEVRANLTYDATGNSKSVTDGRNLSTTYVRNGWGQVIEQNSPDTGRTTYTYDDAGNLVTKLDAATVTTTYVYDELNRLINISYPTDPSKNITYGYDSVIGGNLGIGRLTSSISPAGSTSYIYNALGLVTREDVIIGSSVYSKSYGYDGAGSLTSITYPGGAVVRYNRDAVGRVYDVTLQKNGSVVIEPLVSFLKYQPFGLQTRYIYGNGIANYIHYDQDYRVVGINVSGETLIFIESIYYQSSDLISSVLDGTLLGVNNQSFQYDTEQRLRRADGSSYGSMSYFYDAVGNRESKIQVQGATITQESYNYFPGSNRLDSIDKLINDSIFQPRTLAYDAKGNTSGDNGFYGVQRTYVYGDNNRLNSIIEGATTIVNYTYNAYGQRSIKALASDPRQIHYHYGTDGKLLAETYSDGTVIREYIYLQNQLVSVLDAGTDLYFVHNDHISAQVVTDINQRVVWRDERLPFGQMRPVIKNIITFDPRFPGQSLDEETGFHYNYFRTYDPSTGRYITSDPIGLSGGLNTYAYVGGNPVNFSDPLGLYGDPRDFFPTQAYPAVVREAPQVRDAAVKGVGLGAVAIGAVVLLPEVAAGLAALSEAAVISNASIGLGAAASNAITASIEAGACLVNQATITGTIASGSLVTAAGNGSLQRAMDFFTSMFPGTAPTPNVQGLYGAIINQRANPEEILRR